MVKEREQLTSIIGETNIKVTLMLGKYSVNFRSPSDLTNGTLQTGALSTTFTATLKQPFNAIESSLPP